MADSLQPRRHLDLEGTYNVRDLGGYRTADGRTTRWKTFLRADSLHRMSDESQATLIDYGLRAVIDLRSSGELAERPDVFSTSSDVAYYHRNLLVDGPLAEVDGTGTNTDRSERIARSYARWLDLMKHRYREVLETLAEPGAQPAEFHCAGGKDRTGTVAALLLGIAGVRPETIAQDYSLSGPYLWERYLNWDPPPEESPKELTWQGYQARYCPPEAMLKVLRHLEAQYGGVNGYVRSIGLTEDQIDSLRSALME